MNKAEEESGFVIVDKDIRLFYQKIGKGKSVVIIPLHLYLFEDFKHLATNKTFIFYDVRNRGRSDAVTDGNKLSIQEDVEDLEKIRKNFGLKKFSMIGWTYTGLMGVMYAIKYPNNIERFVQISSSPLKAGTQYPKEFTANDEKSPVDTEELNRLTKLLKQEYESTNPQEHQGFCEKLWDVNKFFFVGNPSNAVKLRSVCALPNEWAVNYHRHLGFHLPTIQKLDIPKSEVSKVTIPVLTIHGTKDRNSVYGAGREWATIPPNARLLTVKGAARFPWIEEPEYVFSAIKTFLAGKFPKEAEKVN